MHLVSIIIPIYNSDKYLVKCLDSILAQTSVDFELLLINDGSTDNSGKICSDYAEKDHRIKVFHQINKGVSSARNLGIKEATAEWICFVDSDDLVLPNYLKDFVIENVSKETDFIIQGIIKKDEGTEHKLRFENQEIKAVNYHQLFHELEIFNYGYPFSKLFRRELVKRNIILFPENLSLAEDLLFLLQYIYHCNVIHFVNKENYIYNIQQGTLSNTKKKPVEYFNRYFQYKNILKNNYKTLFNNVVFSSQYQSLAQSLGSSLYVSIESMYGSYALTRQERLNYFQKIDNEDLHLLSFHNYKQQNVIFRFLVIFCKMTNVKISDYLFFFYFFTKNRRKYKLQSSLNYVNNKPL